MKRKLTAFDMDSTLIQCELMDEMSRIMGKYDQIKAITDAAMQGEIDFAESFNRRLMLLKGLAVEELNQIKRHLPYTNGLADLIAYLKDKNYILAIISGGFDFFAEQIKADHQFDFIHCNRFEVKDGELTGKSIGQIVGRKEKAEILKQLAVANNIDLANTIAIGDGSNDLDMLKTAGRGIAFCAKDIVKKEIRLTVDEPDLSKVIDLLND